MVSNYRRPVKRASSRGRYGAPRRNTTWVRGGQASAVGPVTVFLQDILPDAELDPGARIGSTITRIHLHWQINAGPVTTIFAGAFLGICIADYESMSTINPWADRNLVDWMYWAYVQPGDRDTGWFSNSTESVLSGKIDVKAQRKLNAPAQKPFFFIENNGIDATTGVYTAFSTLVKLA